MSAAARALSLPEIVTRLFVHLPISDVGTASTVSQVWWDAGQFATYLRRRETCRDPDQATVQLFEDLASGPDWAGLRVKHVQLSPGVFPSVAEPVDQPLSSYAECVVRKVLGYCPKLISLTVHGLDHGQAAEELIKLYSQICGMAQLESLQLVGTNVNLSAFAWNIEFPSLRHLALTGLVSASAVPSTYDHFDPGFDTGFGFAPADLDFDPPALGLTSLSLTNTAHRVDPDFRRLGRRALGAFRGAAGAGLVEGLPGAAMTWLLQAASSQTGAPGLRELRYVLDGAEQGTRLSSLAIAAIAQHAPALERAELWLAPENVTSDLQAVLDLTQMASLDRLTLGLFVPVPNRADGAAGRRAGPARNEVGRMRAKVAKAVAALEEERKAKVVLLD